MPKSILKKRADMEPSSGDQSSQVDGFSSSAGAGNSTENILTTESTSSSSPPANAQNAESPVPHGSTLPTTAQTSWALNKSVESGMKGSVPDVTPPCEQNEGPKGNQLSSTLGDLIFSKSTPKSHIDPFCNVNAFSENKEGVQKGADEAGGFLFSHEQDSKSSPLPREPLHSKQRSSFEIEDEERFLYGEEEDKKAEPQKAPSGQTASTPADKSSQNKQEFEKIHDLLKTIGLDIGVAEIGKLAVRTQERLHGKKLAPKISQPAQSAAAAASTAEPKAKVSEPQVKTEKKEKEEAEAAEKTEPPIKPAPKEPTPPATHPSPAHKPKLILRKSLPKETTAEPKANIPAQTPTTISVQPPLPVPNPTPPPMSPSQMPVYSPYPHSPMVPAYNMPPPNYNPYSPYVSYPTSSWSMYSPMPPQPSPPHMQTLAPHVPVSTSASTYNPRSNLRFIETTEDISDTKSPVKSDTKPTTPIAAFLAKQEADRKNKESEKLKVLEELDSVRKEHKVKSESLKTLSIKVEQLRVQQGILLRKKRREKDGHKDPLLDELNNVLESAQKQICSLREEYSTTKQKQQQLTKVAEILGVSPSELAEKSDSKKEERSPGSLEPTRDSDESRTSIDSSKSANDLKTSSEPVSKVDAKAKSESKSGAETKSNGAAYSFKVTEKSEDVKCEGTPPMPSPDPKNSTEPHSPYLSKSEEVSKSRDKSRSKSPRPCPPSSMTPPKSEEPQLFSLSEIFEYYDSGSHWCENCNAICMTLPEFLLHLHDKKHSQCVKAAKQPWVKKKVQESGTTKKQKVNIPLKGSEFLLPVNGYYCELCEELFPDHTAAEEHLRAYAHNDKYKKHTDVHMNYETARRERKRVSLIAAQEVSRKQAEQKRKMTEQKREAHEHSKSKKAKKEDEDRKAKSKSYSSASPSSSDRRRNKTPEKEPSKNSFGKFVWKSTENKTPAAVSSSRVDAASTKPKDEEPKAISLKPKGFAIKLLGKSSALPGNALSPSHSVASTTITSTASTVSSTFTSQSTHTSNAQTKIRPNLPSLANMRSATPLVTMSKPAPLDTFLSIRSSSATSKSIPIVKNKPSGVFPEDLVSKAFGGEVVILKESTQPDSTAKTEKEHERTAGSSPKALQTPKGQDLFNVMISKKDTVENQEAKSEKESSVPKQPVSSSLQKSDPVPTSTQHKTHSAPTKPAQSPGPTTVQQTQISKSVPNSASSTVSITASVKSSISSSTNSLFKLAKSDSPVNSTNQQTAKAGHTPTREESRVQQSQEENSKPENETPQKVKASTFSMNPLTGRLEYIPVQQTKVIDTNVQKLPEPKHTPTAVTHVSNVQVNKPVPSSPVLAVPKTKFIVNNTTKLNQKFKKAPLYLPSSLFGHVQDPGCKDIKISSVESQKSNNRADKFESPLLPSSQKHVFSSSYAKPIPANSSTMQQELDSYYKSIGSEDDPEDLTTSEDQDLEAGTTPADVANAPLQPSPPEKKVKLESSLPPVKASVKLLAPEVSCEDVDESDMACEVPEGPLSSAFQTSGWNFMRASYASNQIHGSSNQRPWSLASGNFSVNKDQSKTTQVTTVAPPENFMEDLSVYVTCDSD
ncbi:zinc finger protein 318 [Bufo bufo]|uniref:zinc finger protein 318 n=1 Tax=Bufo bufo TaxID=8384 RepID=UPI001ABE0A28|nr:zinc finger protein 318 [Bufo bufo]